MTLRTEKLSCIREGRTVLEEITLEFAPCNLYGIIGPNGSGKTSLLKTLAGIWPRSSGSVLWKENDIHSLSRKELSTLVTLVPQNPNPTFNFSVEEFVKMGRYAHGGRAHPGWLEECLEQVDSGHLRKRTLQQLSHGERQRIYVARALATEAQVLLFDEAAANLDVRHQIMTWELMKRLAGQGKIVLASHHDMERGARYCDRIIALSEGKCVAAGACGEVLTQPFVDTLFGL